MYRALVTVLLGFGVAAGLSAGQIQIGGTTGLTSAYISGGCASANGPSFAGCVSGSTTGFTELNYDATLYSLVAPNPTPFTGYLTSTATTAGSTLTDSANGETFEMLSDGLTGSSKSANYWGANAGTNSLTIPVGIYGVDQVSTMLNDAYGPNGTNDTVITFNFGTSSNNANLSSVIVDLLNGTEIRGSVHCTGGTYCGSSSPQSGFAGSLALNTPLSSLATGDPSGVTVLTNDLLSTTAYNSNISGSSYSLGYKGTNGNLYLDDQVFQLGLSYASAYLVSITVQDLHYGAFGGTSTVNSGSASASETSLSAVTVDTLASESMVTPEPSTVILFGIGIVLVVWSRRFRRAS